jgi:small-conductance mechanosensitive channel
VPDTAAPSADVGPVLESLKKLGTSTLAYLPRFGVFLLLIALSWLLARGVGAAVLRVTGRREGRALALAFARVTKVLIVVAGVLVAATTAFPTFTPGDLVTTLGLGSVAVGLVFKDVFQNFLAGVLMLVTKPFRVGDQIRFQDFEGTVEDIQARATLLTTYDGRRVVLPNAQLYTNPVVVNTAFACRRSEYDVGVGYGDDVARAKELILTALRETEGVLADPAPEVLVVELAESSVNLRARWWTTSRIRETLYVQDRVLERVEHDLPANGVDLPFPTRQILLHDQTERTDGDRRAQREGWPAGHGDVPDARGVAAVLEARDAPDPGDG